MNSQTPKKEPSEDLLRLLVKLNAKELGRSAAVSAQTLLVSDIRENLPEGEFLLRFEQHPDGSRHPVVQTVEGIEYCLYPPR